MRGRLAFTVATAILLNASGLVMADTHVDAGEARLEIKDQRDAECGGGWFAFCQAGMSNATDPRNGTVDVNQNFSYIGAGASVDPLVPIGVDYQVYGREGYVPNPIFPFVGETWSNSALAPGIPGVFEVRFEDPTIWLDYNSLNRSDPTRPSVFWNELGMSFPDGDQRLGYNQIGPFNGYGSTDTDERARTYLESACGFSQTHSPECYQTADGLADSQAAYAPDVRYGISFYEVEAASDASRIGDYSNYAAPLNYASQAWALYQPDPAPTRLDDQNVPRVPILLPQVGPDQSVPVHAHTGPEQTPSGVALQIAQPPNSHTSSLVTAVTVGGIGLLLLGVLLYSRIRSRNEAIASAARSRIYGLITNTPGISPAALAAELGLTRNGIIHHLRVMERTHMISVRSEGQKTFIYAGRPDPDRISALIARADAAGVILAALRNTPEGLTKEEVVAATRDLPKRTRDHSLRQLVLKGVLAIRDDPQQRYAIAEPRRDISS